ncbi:MAG: hypothetical protein LCI00_15450 [Chloroflexi bacterium]|nr:hypothetical protein [Chloroflexota bacterium]
MTRLFGGGVLIDVALQNGALPKHFRWQRRVHPVKGVTNTWRVDFGWWRLRIWRDYFKLHTTTGLLVVIYHDLLTDSWYLQTIYD